MTILDFAQGFGAVQLANGIPTSSSKKGVFYHHDSLESEKRQYYSVYVGDASKDLSVTLAWYDPPSTVSSYNVRFLLLFLGFVLVLQTCSCSCS